MRRRSTLALLPLALLAACATARRPLAPEPPPPEIVQPARPPSGLQCLEHPRIDHWERRLRSAHLRRDTDRILARGEPYLPHLRRIVAAHGLPESLALLPAIESGFRPEARGRFGERGLWQLRRPTARHYGLVVDQHRDERTHPERSTEAAARYLRHLNGRYGDWPLALAAYNAGESRVNRALARDPHASFWELAEQGWLPRTSRDFVPRFIAVVRVADPTRACGQASAPRDDAGERVATRDPLVPAGPDR